MSQPSGTGSTPESPGRLQFLLGPLVTLAFTLVCTPWSYEELRAINGTALLALLSAGSAFAGGPLAGVLSAAIASVFFALKAAEPGWPLHWTGEAAIRVPVAIATYWALAVMMGVLRERAVHAAAHARAETDFRELLEQVPAGIFLSDREGHYLYANEQAERMTGYTYGQLRGMHVTDLIAPESLAQVPPKLQELEREGEVRVRRWLLRRDGSRFLAEVLGRRLRDGRLLGQVHDITHEQEARDRLERTLATLNATLESTREGILAIDTEGQWIARNARFNGILRAPEALVEAQDLAGLRRYLAGQSVDSEMFLSRLDGIMADTEGESFDEVVFKDGRIVERTSVPLRVGGKPVGRVFSMRDVTDERRQALALRESERRVMQSQKTEAIGRLAGGIAHDFNNMLTAILGEADLLRTEVPAGTPVREAIERIRDAANRSAQLTRQLLSYSRRHQRPAADVDLARMLRDMEPILARLARPGHQLRLALPDDGAAPVVHAEGPMLEQAVVNLVVNGYDAMATGGTLHVRLRPAVLGAADSQRLGAPGPGPYACIEVEDSGSGIPPEVRAHLFEPFFTTKPPGKGTGLGLASVQGAVQEAGGFVEVRSEPGRGACFALWLPLVSGVAAGRADRPAPEARAATDARAQDGALVLVVEDEDSVRQFAVTVLRRAGWRVIEAANGAEAIAAFEAMPEPPALVLSDVRMPGISGIGLERRLLDQRPNLRVVLMSGWTGEALDELEDSPDRLPLLSKPFGGDDLVAAVRKALAAPPPREA